MVLPGSLTLILFTKRDSNESNIERKYTNLKEKRLRRENRKAWRDGEGRTH